MRPWTPEDASFMHRALRLALRGQGRVEPNPMVGCVIVREGRVIGEGWHRRFGGPHAEVEALRRCRSSPRGATVYVALEPCCHYGKTPPCTDALIAARVRRVVAALRDPNPAVAGRGLQRLRRAGVRVELGLLADEAGELNAPYLKLTRRRLPWLILKWAQSLDGKIATHTGDSKWISDAAARAHAHRTRGRVDAIIVGVHTVLRDDPRLTCRVARPRRIATRVVLDSRLRTPADAKLVRTSRRVPTWIFCRPDAPPARARRLERAGCVIRRVRAERDGLSLGDMLRTLGAAGMTNVLVEGGSRLLGAFFDQRLADELHIYVAPLLIGGQDALGPLHGIGAARIRDALRLKHAKWARLGDGWLVQVRLAPTVQSPARSRSRKSGN